MHGEAEENMNLFKKGVLELGNTHTKSAFEHPEDFSIQLLSAHHLHNLEKTDACSGCLAESNDFILSPVGSRSLHFVHSSGGFLNRTALSELFELITASKCCWSTHWSGVCFPCLVLGAHVCAAEGLC